MDYRKKAEEITPYPSHDNDCFFWSFSQFSPPSDQKCSCGAIKEREETVKSVAAALSSAHAAGREELASETRIHTNVHLVHREQIKRSKEDIIKYTKEVMAQELGRQLLKGGAVSFHMEPEGDNAKLEMTVRTLRPRAVPGVQG